MINTVLKLYEKFSAFYKENKISLIFRVWIILVALIYLLVLLNKGLAVGFSLALFLSLLTLLIASKFGIRDRELYLLFAITLLVHLFAVLFIYYLEFRPVGGGADFEGYHSTAVEVSQRFQQGVFSLEGLRFSHYFALIIGIIYTFTLPEMIVGQMFTVFLATMTIFFVYLIIKEITDSKKWAFLIGLIINLYPSYLYFGSLLLKDTLVIPLALSGLLLFIKIMKQFSWWKFLFFFVILTSLTHFRFYIGYALLFSFIISWFFISGFNLKKRLAYGVLIVILLGFSPQILGYGYYGTKPIIYYTNPDVITSYREIVYAPTPEFAALTEVSSLTEEQTSKTKPSDVLIAKTPTENTIIETPKKEVPPEEQTPKTKPSDVLIAKTPIENTTKGTPKKEVPLESTIIETPKDPLFLIKTETKSESIIKPFQTFFDPLFSDVQKLLVLEKREELQPLAVSEIEREKPPYAKKPFRRLLDSKESGVGSSFVIETGLESPFKFVKNSTQSFLYSLLGPLPWQIKYQRHLFALLETIPWYLLLYVFFGTFIESIKTRGILNTIKYYRLAIPLLFFSIMALGALSLFINNYGIIVRVRMSIFITLLCLMSITFGLNDQYFNNLERYSTKLYEKIFNYRRGWIHWI